MQVTDVRQMTEEESAGTTAAHLPQEKEYRSEINAKKTSAGETADRDQEA